MQLTPRQIDIIDACRVAIVCTNGPAGRPHASATWFERDGDTIRVSIAETGQKAKNIARDPRGTLFFVDPANSVRTVELRGTLQARVDEGFVDAIRIGDKYGDDLTRYVAPGERRITVTIVADRIVDLDFS